MMKQELYSCEALDAWIKRTHLFRRSLEIRREIDLHKWYESEKAGYDIGRDRASIDWLIHHSKDFFQRKKYMD